MNLSIRVEPLTQSAFSPFGDILEAEGAPDRIINQGACGRWHDLATLDVDDGRVGHDGCGGRVSHGGHGGHVGLSLFRTEPRTLPYRLDMMERHPKGSQAFLPMSFHPFLVVVADDDHGRPARPRAFVTAPGQGVNYHRNVWHGVLCPLHPPGLFAVIDRIGPGTNLAEHWFDEPFSIEAASNEIGGAAAT